MRSEKSIKHIALACLVSVSISATAPPAKADEPAQWFGNWNTQGTLLKEWFEWRAATGWGVIGVVNIITSYARKDPRDVFTKQVVTSICGAAAAGLLAMWKPPGAGNWEAHFASIIKGGSVVGIASFCGWVTEMAFIVANLAKKKAENLYAKASAATKAKLRGYAANAQNNANQIEIELKKYVEADKQRQANLKEWFVTCHAGDVTNPFNYPHCDKVKYNLNYYKVTGEQALSRLDRNFNLMKSNMQLLNKTLGV